MAPKRKLQTAAPPVPATTSPAETAVLTGQVPAPFVTEMLSHPVAEWTAAPGHAETNPDRNAEILDSKTALRASPDADEKGESLDVGKVVGRAKRRAANDAGKRGKKTLAEDGHSSDLSDAPADTIVEPSPKRAKKTPTKASVAAKRGSDEIKAFRAAQAAQAAVVKKEEPSRDDPEGEGGDVVEDADTEKREAKRPPPVNSDYLPLPWKGRLGYVGLAHVPL